MISASIVIYNQKFEVIKSLLFNIIDIKIISKLFIIDNSPTNELQAHIKSEKIEYIFLDRNIGFGAGHNMALNKAILLKMKYHFVINPDIYFLPNTIEKIIEFLDNNSEIGLLMPKILYPDGSVQYLPKLIPHPFDLLVRRVKFLRKVFAKRLQKYELEQLSNSTTFDAPIISGCFSCLRIEILRTTGLYDEQFFMYFEDFDLSRRINMHYRTVYFSDVSIFHEYERGAEKSFRLFKVYILSLIKYFNKWGWLFDKNRSAINDATLKKIK